jgi:hypothetical protein
MLLQASDATDAVRVIEPSPLAGGGNDYGSADSVG